MWTGSASTSAGSAANAAQGHVISSSGSGKQAGSGEAVVAVVIPHPSMCAETVAVACGCLYRAGASPIVAAVTADMVRHLAEYGVGATDALRSAALVRHAASAAGPRARLCVLQLFTRRARAALERDARRRLPLAAAQRRTMRVPEESMVFTQLGVDVLVDGIPSVPACAGASAATSAYELDARDVTMLELAAQRCVAVAASPTVTEATGGRCCADARRSSLVHGLSRLLVRGGILRHAYPLLCVPWLPPRGSNAESDALREEAALRAGVVINVRRRVDRMARASEMLAACGLANVRRFDAVTPGDCLRLELARKAMREQEAGAGDHAGASRASPHTEDGGVYVSEAELACAASHAIVWDAVSRAPDTEWFLVIEDDAIPARELGAYETGDVDAVTLTALAARVASLHPECGWVSLSTNLASRHLLAHDGAEPVVRALSPSVRWLTTAYLLRARGARHLRKHARLGMLGADAEMMLVSQALCSSGKDRFVAATAWAGLCTAAGTAGIWQQDARDSDLEMQRAEQVWCKVLAAMKSRAEELNCSHWIG